MIFFYLFASFFYRVGRLMFEYQYNWTNNSCSYLTSEIPFQSSWINWRDERERKTYHNRKLLHFAYIFFSLAAAKSSEVFALENENRHFFPSSIYFWHFPRLFLCAYTLQPNYIIIELTNGKYVQFGVFGRVYVKWIKKMSIQLCVFESAIKIHTIV